MTVKITGILKLAVLTCLVWLVLIAGGCSVINEAAPGGQKPETVTVEEAYTLIMDDAGNIIFTKLDIATLTDIARSGNGRFYPITPQQSEILEILNNINAIEKKKFDSKEYVRYKEQYHWFVAIALALLCIEWLIVTRKKTTLRRNV